MGSMFNNHKTIVPNNKKKEDVLDLLLKMSHTEREAFLAELKRGERMTNEVQVTYDRNATTKPKSTMSFYY